MYFCILLKIVADARTTYSPKVSIRGNIGREKWKNVIQKNTESGIYMYGEWHEYPWLPK